MRKVAITWPTAYLASRQQLVRSTSSVGKMELSLEAVESRFWGRECSLSWRRKKAPSVPALSQARQNPSPRCPRLKEIFLATKSSIRRITMSTWKKNCCFKVEIPKSKLRIFNLRGLARARNSKSRSRTTMQASILIGQAKQLCKIYTHRTLTENWSPKPGAGKIPTKSPNSSARFRLHTPWKFLPICNRRSLGRSVSLVKLWTLTRLIWQEVTISRSPRLLTHAWHLTMLVQTKGCGQA